MKKTILFTLLVSAASVAVAQQTSNSGSNSTSNSGSQSGAVSSSNPDMSNSANNNVGTSTSNSGSNSTSSSGSYSGSESNGNQQGQGQSMGQGQSANNTQGQGQTQGQDAHNSQGQGQTQGQDAHNNQGQGQSQGANNSQGQSQTANTQSQGQGQTANGGAANNTASQSNANMQGQMNGQNVALTFNNTNRRTTQVNTNTPVGLVASSSFSSDYCGGTMSGGASAAPIGISIGLSGPRFDKSCQALRRAEKFGMAAANASNMGHPDLAGQLMSMMIWSICTADSSGPGADQSTAMACEAAGLLGPRGGPHAQATPVSVGPPVAKQQVAQNASATSGATRALAKNDVASYAAEVPH